MSHTPEQARELWCPIVRIARREDNHPDEGGAVVVAGCNTDALGGLRVPASCRCIADKCAMWRFYDMIQERLRINAQDCFANHEPERPANLPATWTFQPYDDEEGFSARWIEPKEEAAKRRRGYCGLAGRPEFITN